MEFILLSIIGILLFGGAAIIFAQINEKIKRTRNRVWLGFSLMIGGLIVNVILVVTMLG